MRSQLWASSPWPVSASVRNASVPPPVRRHQRRRSSLIPHLISRMIEAINPSLTPGLLSAVETLSLSGKEILKGKSGSQTLARTSWLTLAAPPSVKPPGTVIRLTGFLMSYGAQTGTVTERLNFSISPVSALLSGCARN